MSPHNRKWLAFGSNMLLAGALMSGCKDQQQVDLNQLSGEWRVLSTTLVSVNGVSTTQRIDLGNLVFENCNYRQKGTCAGYRRLVTGDSIKFQFVPASTNQPRVGLSFLTSVMDADWSGTYTIERAGEESVLHCEQCVAAGGGNFTIVLLRQ